MLLSVRVRPQLKQRTITNNNLQAVNTWLVHRGILNKKCFKWTCELLIIYEFRLG